jgi:predicted glycosyltransferase
MAPDGVSTMEVAVGAEVVLTWTSTVGVQAAFMGKPVVYYSPPSVFDAHLVEEGIALRAEEETLARVLDQALQSQADPEAIKDALVRAGYVVGADSVVADLVLEALGLDGA